MSDTKMSFDDFVQQGRRRRKAEKLAQEIFGSNRKPSVQKNDRRQSSAPMGGSLASRMGVNKRTNQRAPTSAPQTWNRPPPTGPRNQPAAPTGPRQDFRADKIVQNSRQQQSAGYSSRPDLFSDRLPQTELSSTRPDLFPNRQQQTNDYQPRHDLFPGRQQQPIIVSDPPSALSVYANVSANQKENEPEISIRGAAGPFCVIASNFAPGTTAADVEQVMLPVGGEMLSCKLVAAEPTVIIEMLFVTKAGADNVISMFNNRRADGSVLYVYFKKGEPTKPLSPAAERSPLRLAPRASRRAEKSPLRLAPRSGPRSVRLTAHSRSASNPSSSTLSLEPPRSKGAVTPRDEVLVDTVSGNQAEGRIPTGPRAEYESEPNANIGRPYNGRDNNRGRRGRGDRVDDRRGRNNYNERNGRDQRDRSPVRRDRGGHYRDNNRARSREAYYHHQQDRR